MTDPTERPAGAEPTLIGAEPTPTDAEPTPGERPAGAQPTPTDAEPTPGEPSPPRGRRTLERAPGERYARGRGAALDAIEAAGGGTPGRAIAFGLVGGAIGLVVFLGFAIPLSFSAGLVVIPIFMARLIGLFVRAGAAGSLSSPARVVAAVLILLGGVAVANIAIWLWALRQGGVLALPEYLDETYGTPLVALEFMLGTLTAWRSAR